MSHAHTDPPAQPAQPATGVVATAISREFVFRGQKLPDPDPALTVDQVKQSYVPAYPPLATATVEGPEMVGGVARYTFATAVGHKG